MSNVERFLSEFNQLHRTLKEVADRDTSFGGLLTYLKTRHPVIQRYFDRLNVIRELRNLITHEDYVSDVYIAEPSDEVILELEMIRKKVARPGRAEDYFISPVETVDVTDTLISLLELVQKFDYTKFPVFSDKKLLGVLSDTGVLHWLSNQKTDRPLDLRRVTIQDVITTKGGYSEVFLFHKVVPKHTTLYEIEEWFSQNLKRGRAQSLMLLSEEESVKTPQDILGVITASDLQKIEANL